MMAGKTGLSMTLMSVEMSRELGFLSRHGGGDGEDAICDPLARSAYRAYVGALSELWGAPSDNTRDDHTEHSWVLPNDVTVRLGGLSALITVEIGSPSITQLDREIAYYEEKGYLTPGTLDVS